LSVIMPSRQDGVRSSRCCIKSAARSSFFLSIGGDAIYLLISVLTSLPVKICVIIDALSSSRTCTFTVAVPLSHARVTVSLFFDSYARPPRPRGDTRYTMVHTINNKGRFERRLRRLSLKRPSEFSRWPQVPGSIDCFGSGSAPGGSGKTEIRAPPLFTKNIFSKVKNKKRDEGRSKIDGLADGPRTK
jgi:hypothetical protein